MSAMPTDLLSGGSQKSHELAISVFVALICLCNLIGHLLEPYCCLNESIAAVFLVFGFLTKPLADSLVPHDGQGKSNHQNTKSLDEEPTLPLLSQDNPLRKKGRLIMLLERPVGTIHVYRRKFNDK